MQTYKSRNLFWALLVALALMTSACAGIVVSPIDETVVAGTTRFWGYAIQPGQSLQLEALNTSNVWEVLASTTSGSTPTYAGTQTGYYFELSYNPVTAPTRFRRTAPWSTHRRIHFRIQTPGLGPADTRQWSSNGSNPQGIESNLERWWAQYKGNGVIRIDFQI
jgi:hypothetical protein